MLRFESLQLWRVHRAGPLAIDLALRLTLLDLLLRPVGNWLLRPFILGLAVVALLQSRLLRHPLLWLCLAALTGARVVLDWPLSDNHAYLLSYWCLACALALMTPEPNKTLAGNAHLLIGLVFLFACVWKFIGSGDYADATFFQVLFLSDPRFQGFTEIAGGLDRASFEALSDLVARHRDQVPQLGDATTAGLPIPQSLRSLALAATLWNLFINAALAISFLWPSGPRLIILRHSLLLVYCVVTYAIATVDGFGWLLLAMAVAQCDYDQRRLRMAYMLVFVLIIFYREVPWASVFFELAPQ